MRRVARVTLDLTQESLRGCPIQGREATLSGGFCLPDHQGRVGLLTFTGN